MSFFKLGKVWLFVGLGVVIIAAFVGLYFTVFTPQHPPKVTPTPTPTATTHHPKATPSLTVTPAPTPSSSPTAQPTPSPSATLSPTNPSTSPPRPLLTPQAITFTGLAPSGAIYGGANYTPAATATSGLSVVFTSGTPTVCIVSSGVVGFVGAGTCTIDANQAGNSTYASAPQLQQSFSVGRASLTITASNNSMTYGGSVPAITASYLGFAHGDTAGSLTTQPTCSTLATSTSAVAGSPYASNCSGAVDVNYNFTYVAGGVALGVAPLTITAVSDTIAYGSTIPAITASYSGLVSGQSAGSLTTQPTCSTTATSSSSVTGSPYPTSCSGAVDSNYAITYIDGTVTITKAAQVLSFTSLAPTTAVVNGATYLAIADSTSGLTVALTVDASSSSVCSIALGVVSFQGAGTCEVDSNQAGNTNYLAASQVQQSFRVAKESQAISFTSNAPTNAIVNGNYMPTADSTSGLAVELTIDSTSSAVCSISSGLVSFNQGGTCTVDANQPGGGNYAAALQVQQSFLVAKAAQAISFTSTVPGEVEVGGPTYSVAALANSGLPVALSIDASSSLVCSISSGQVSFQEAGVCTIDANQGGSSAYLAAPPVQQSFTVFALTISLGVDNANPNAGAAANFTATTAGFVSGDFIVISDSNGHLYQFCSAAPCLASDTEYGSDTYTGTLYNASGDALTASALITVTWPGTLILSVDNSSPALGVAANFTATANDFASGDTIYIYDSDGNFSQICTTNPCTASDAEAGSDTYTAVLYNASSSMLATSDSLTVVWPPTPIISLSVDNANPAAGVAANFTATAIGFSSGDTISIFDANGNLDQTCTTNPCLASDTESGSDIYTAILDDANGNYLAVSSAVTVTWPSPSCPQIINTNTEFFAGTPYLFNCTINVPSGDTLTIDPGVIMKFGSGDGFTIEGNLEALGTTADPITFTSLNDNSVGGNTGSGSPASGDWEGISLTGVGTLDLNDATLNYSNQAIYESDDILGNPGSGSITASNDAFLADDSAINVNTTGAVVVTDDAFTDNATTPVAIDSTTPVVENNSVAQSAGQGYPAFSINGTALNANLFRGNTVSGSGVLGFALGGTLGTNSTLDAEPDPWGVDGEVGLDVPSGITLTITLGTAVTSVDSENGSLGLTVEGALDAVGTATSPITFGGSAASISAYGAGILNVEYAIIESASGGITQSDSDITLASDPGSGSSVISNDTFLDSQLGVGFIGSGPLSIDTTGTVIVTNNTFTANTGVTPVFVESPTPTVENNSVSQSTGQGYPAFYIAGTALDLDLLRGNTASGGGVNGFDIGSLETTGGDSTMGTSATLDAESDTWEVGGLYIPTGITLTISPGAIVKGAAVSGGDSVTYIGICVGIDNYCSLEVEGTLNAVGTETSPITFTSINDNTIGGFTGDGDPAAGDWDGIDVNGSGSINLDYATVAYADTGVQASTNQNVSISDDEFDWNATAVNINATLGTNAEVQDNWFDQNEVALTGSSIWNPLTALDAPLCQYIPTIPAGGNIFGASQSSIPFFSPSDWTEVQLLLGGADQYPDSWTDNIQSGPTDQITYAAEPCFSYNGDDDLEPETYIASPFSLNGS